MRITLPFLGAQNHTIANLRGTKELFSSYPLTRYDRNIFTTWSIRMFRKQEGFVFLNVFYLSCFWGSGLGFGQLQFVIRLRLSPAL